MIIRNTKIAVIVLVGLIAGVGGGLFFGWREVNLKNQNIFSQLRPIRILDSKTPLINPLLGYDSAEANDYGYYKNLKINLQKLVDTEVSQKQATRVSIYYRDLVDGQWIGIDQDTKYSPASLFKVPLMMAYYRWSETTAGVLDKALQFNGPDLNQEETIKPSQVIQPGQSYTVDELLRRMIIYSDNNAMQLLLNNIDQSQLNEFYANFNVLIPGTTTPQDFISPKNYALFFRVLIGSTYLNEADSEKALELLSQSEFKDGLSAGVPGNVLVAHKFGEYGLDNNGTITNREFHDCGIIYRANNNPYLLCIMTAGDNLNNLESIVRDISKQVYEGVH